MNNSRPDKKKVVPLTKSTTWAVSMDPTKGQLISKCLFEKIVWTKIPPKNLIDSALKYCRAESIKFFGAILVQTIFSKRRFEIN